MSDPVIHSVEDLINPTSGTNQVRVFRLPRRGHLHERTSAGRWRKRMSTSAVWLAWGYLALVVVTLGLLRFASDRWWLATFLLFGPLWIVLLPLPILGLLSAWFHRKSLVLLAVALILAVGPVMGYCLTWTGLVGGQPESDFGQVRVMAWNCGNVKDWNAFAELVRRCRPDLILFEEWSEDSFTAIAGEADWDFRESRGLAIASRFPIVDSQPYRSKTFEGWRNLAVRHDIESPWGAIQVVGVHLETPREGIDAMVRFKLHGIPIMNETTEVRRKESAETSRIADEALGPTIVGGDFNMPVESAIYQRYWSHWQNAFSTAGLGFGHTKFTWLFDVRIDHVLASDHWTVLAARVGPDLGGDHRPVIAELQLRNGGD